MSDHGYFGQMERNICHTGDKGRRKIYEKSGDGK